ncbi:hypothetical protein JHK82_047831 [Glycine max]|nr:hypothetical protein JHK82_047831 [Glycine max]
MNPQGDSDGQTNTNNKNEMMPHLLFETLELLPLFLLTPKNVGQVEDMPRADDMAPLLGQETTMFRQVGTLVGTPSFNLTQRLNHLELRQLVSGYVDDNVRVRNAQAVVYHLLNDQAGPSTSRPLESQRLNYSGGASSSRTQNYQNQVQVLGSGVPPYVRHGPSLSPLPSYPSAEERIRLSSYETFEEGNQIGKLHSCINNHHHYIRQWLLYRNFCLVCKRVGLETNNNVKSEATRTDVNINENDNDNA